MRVTGGGARGRRLRAGAAPGLRPTSSRVRQALFNLLGARITGCTFLDLYAGTGAVGIEALSRGAGEVVFVERDAAAARFIRRNLDEAGLVAAARVLAASVETAIRDLGTAANHFDIVYADPPWDPGIPASVLEGAARLLAAGGVLIVEHRTSCPPLIPEALGLRPGRRYRHGDATLAVFHRDQAEHGA
jgi:16S rRNA (guanine(966)-N(2))-methyltransferase RsmD